MRRADYENIAYGKNGSQKLDIYLPLKESAETSNKIPVILLIHGGGFYCCDKRDFHIRPAEIFLERGFSVVAVNYRMAPDFPFPFPGRDIAGAVRWIQKNGASYGLDCERLFLYGTSAGGCLAAIRGLQAERKNVIRGIGLCCPVIRLNTWKEELLQMAYVPEEHIREVDKILLQYLPQGENMKANADYYIDLKKEYKIPVFLQHGDRDRLVSIRQSEYFYAKLKEAGWKDVELEILPGADHAGAGEDFFKRSVIEHTIEFFEKYL